jgi:hypothetical protein
MALESGTYINSLNSANPVATDGLAQADDHLRLLKATILASFPGITGAMTATHTVLNGLDARVTTLESSLPAPQGTRLLFQQTAAPTGWTKDTTHNDKTIRVVTGTVSSGGTNAFSSAFSYTPAGSVNTSVTGTVANHTLTTSQIPAHQHFLAKLGTTSARQAFNSTTYISEGYVFANTNHEYTLSGSTSVADAGLSSSVGGSQGHNHGWSGSASSAFTGTATDFAPQYVDTIIASKD